MTSPSCHSWKKYIQLPICATHTHRRKQFYALAWFCCHLTLQWRHNGLESVSNYQPHDCLLNRLFRRRSKETAKLRVTGLCEGNSPGTGEFPAQMASNAENVSIWWRHHESVVLWDVVDRFKDAEYRVYNTLAFTLLPVHGDMFPCLLHAMWADVLSPCTSMPMSLTGIILYWKIKIKCIETRVAEF